MNPKRLVKLESAIRSLPTVLSERFNKGCVASMRVPLFVTRRDVRRFLQFHGVTVDNSHILPQYSSFGRFERNYFIVLPFPLMNDHFSTDLSMSAYHAKSSKKKEDFGGDNVDNEFLNKMKLKSNKKPLLEALRKKISLTTDKVVFTWSYYILMNMGTLNSGENKLIIFHSTERKLKLEEYEKAFAHLGYLKMQECYQKEELNFYKYNRAFILSFMSEAQCLHSAAILRNVQITGSDSIFEAEILK